MKKHPTLLQVLRQQLGLKQDELAIKCGMTQAFISLVERKRWTSKVSDETLETLAKHLQWDGEPGDLLLPAISVTQ